MADKYRISNLTIEGFRGVNRKIVIDLDRDSAVFSGPNGVGKSSIMEAIEWCLFGRLMSAVKGPVEFRKEDAIINSFHPEKRAIVAVVLESHEGKKATITRGRKLGRSTTAGRTELKIKIEGTEYVGDTAENELNKLLKITPAEFYASMYLHQEAIRDLIVGNPLVRSEVIDKLLGLHSVRELIGSLPVKRVAKEARGVREEINNIKNREMQELVISRKRLGELEAEMEKAGIEVGELRLTSLVAHIEDVSKQIGRIRQELETGMKALEKPSEELGSCERALAETKKAVNELETAWTNVYKEDLASLSTLDTVKDNYEKALEELASLKTKDPKELLARKSEILNQISEAETESNEKISARRFLQQVSMVVHRLYSVYDEANGQLGDIEKEFGGKANIEGTLENLKSKIEDKREAVGREESLGALLVSGLDYLRSSMPENCPLCKSDIVCESVISILEKETSDRKSATVVRRLQNELEELRQQLTRTENILSDFSRFEHQIATAESGIDREREKLKKESFEPKGDLRKYIDGELQRVRAQISDIDQRVWQLKSEASEVDLRLGDLQRKLQRVASLEKKGQDLVGVQETGEMLITVLAGRIGDLERHVKTLDGVTEDIREIRGSLEVCDRILGFLREKVRVDQLEQGLPLLRERLKDLEEKYSGIKEIEMGLEDIYQAASTAREEMVKKALSELHSTVGSYYKRILCHPYYTNVQLIPEKERGRDIYRIRAWDEDFKQGTYVQTRFSNAQMNAVALSIFLSMSMRLHPNLSLILLDDPSQSMDEIHKQALSELLGEISTERQIFVATQDTEFEQCLERSLSKDETKMCKLKEWNATGPKISLSG